MDKTSGLPCSTMRAARQAGFTLLEVMVATAILAGGLATVVGGIGMTVRSTALSTGYERARLVAETQLAEFVAERPDGARRDAGDDGGVHWSLVAETDDDNASVLRITVEASFLAAGGQRTLRLETREMSRSVPERSQRTERTSSQTQS